MTIAQALQSATQKLKHSASPALDVELLLSHILRKPREFLYTHPEVLLTQLQQNRFSRLISRRQKREPVAYIVGHKEFFGLDFKVNKHVLIPRPETELLVEEVLRRIGKIKSPSVIDVGIGSGAIAVAVKHMLPQAQVFASESSKNAIRLAQQNAKTHKTKITIRHGSYLSPFPNKQFDCIVSNPPYLTAQEMRNPDLRFEPTQALFGGKKGLEVYKKLIVQTLKHIKPNGYCMLEIGYNQGRPLTQFLKKVWPTVRVEIKKDLAGLDRVLVINLQS